MKKRPKGAQLVGGEQETESRALNSVTGLLPQQLLRMALDQGDSQLLPHSRKPLRGGMCSFTR